MANRTGRRGRGRPRATQAEYRERFLGRVEMPASGFGCWLWTHGYNSRGYAQFAYVDEVLGRGTNLAHRFAYREWRGPLVAGLTIEHLCGTKSCVNPWHLDQVTQKENIHLSPRWQAWQRRGMEQTHCPSGHELTPENTILRKKNGWRSCRICQRRHWRNWRARQQAA